MKHSIGIDPGKGGGMAWLDPDGVVVDVVKMPDTERDIWDVLYEWTYDIERKHGAFAHATIEKVHSSPQMGVKSAFTFGYGFGGLRMALIACEVPFELVSPGVWQRKMGCLTKGDKNVTKRKCQELFPSVKVTHNIADALLIAEWGRRQR